MTRRIAVANADDSSGASEFKSDFVVGSGDEAIFVIKDFDRDDSDVFTIGIDCLTIGCEPDGGRRASGFLLRFRN